MAKTFVVTQLRGLSRASKSQRATLTALGLRGRHKSVTIADNAANRGQIMKVQHLIQVEVQR
jgi:large subunit ribosomal protein L30